MNDLKLKYLIASRQFDALRAAGYSASDVPVLIKPYTQIWADLQSKKRVHDQGTFGSNVCGTLMCTAGHLVSVAGNAGAKLLKKFGNSYISAATALHYAAHPDMPVQNYGAISDDLALGYIEFMAQHEATLP